ncbi:MAG TPA: ABC transporter permease, partial [Coxiellaceae bacterium]|nr:ABC transporter permease [Coxiellaceae bacterium]
MIHKIRLLGRSGLTFCYQVGRAGIFLMRVLTKLPRRQQGWEALCTQLYQVGILSLAIILLSATFIGMVVALQGFNTLQKFGAEQELGQLIALSVTRELAPVVTALLFAGRAGSALTAEIGLMSATEQLDCMQMMAVDPLWRVI